MWGEPPVRRYVIFGVKLIFKKLNNMTDILSLKYVYASVIYSLIGIFILVISFVILEKVTPENIYKEIVQKGNTALAIIAGAFIIAVAIIISSAIHG